ncbi:MAG TPA: ROK family protein [Jatrophihabitans sp.]|nr:ROK family protein [Jatrophihabitans sp.]
MSRPASPADQQTVRRHNLALVVAAVAEQPGSRAALAQRTGLTKATVSSLVDALLAQRILVEGEPPASRVGRPARPVSLNPAGPPALGLEINVDYLAACLLELTGAVRARQLLPVDNRDRPVAEIVQQLLELAQGLAPAGPLLGVALAVPGVVGPGQVLVRAPNLPGLTGAALAEPIGQGLSTSGVLVDNEANFGALGCLHGLRPGPDFVYVSGEIGVGAGLVVHGSLFRGTSGYAGELGHVVVQQDGPPCGCGGRGCVEQYAGQDVLLRRAGVADPAALESAVRAGEAAAVAAVTEAGRALGVGLASLLNVLDLPRVVLGGLYARLFAALTPPLLAELDRRLVSGIRPELLPSAVGAEAAVLGAAGAVVEQALKDPAALSF